MHVERKDVEKLMNVIFSGIFTYTDVKDVSYQEIHVFFESEEAFS